MRGVTESMPDSPPPWTPRQRGAWYRGITVAALILAALSWLLARLIWLPFLFGLFFFLVAGLIAGAVGFRLAKPARPVPSGRIKAAVVVLSLLAAALTVLFEYRHFRDIAIGDPPRFADARNAVVAAGGSLRELAARAANAFEKALADHWPPGGTAGYVLWSIRSGSLPIEVDGHTEKVVTTHSGLLWPGRTLLAAVLIAAGLWAGLESLRSATPVNNILPFGEEYIEDDG